MAEVWDARSPPCGAFTLVCAHAGVGGGSRAASAALLGTPGGGRRAEGRLCFSPHTRARSLEEPHALPRQSVWPVPQLGARCSPGAHRARSPTRDFHKPRLSLFSRWSCLGLTPTLSSPLAGRAGDARLQPSGLAHERGKKELSW